MRLRANFRGIVERLTVTQERHLLNTLINNSNRYYLEEHLRTFNIPGRTKIYKAFGWSYGLYADREDRSDNQIRHVESILQHSDIVDWVEKYCSEYTLGSFLSIANQCKIDLNGFNIRIEGHRDE